MGYLDYKYKDTFKYLFNDKSGDDDIHYNF